MAAVAKNPTVAVDDALRVFDDFRNLGYQPGLIEIRRQRASTDEQPPLVPLRADQDRNAVRRTLPDRIQRQFRKVLAVDDWREAHAALRQPEPHGALQQRFWLKREQLVDIVSGQAELPHDAFSDRFRAFERVRGARRTADRHRAVEESLRRLERQQCPDAHGAGRLAHDGDVAGVSAERRDVVANPFQRLDLVQQPLVSGRWNAPARHPVQVEKSQRADPIVDRDHHDIAAPGHDLAVVDRRAPGAAGETAAVDPHQHRSFAVVEAGRPDV